MQPIELPASEGDEVITIGLFGTEEKGWDAALREIANVGKIYNGFSKAAAARGNPPPRIVLSALLIPDWNSHSSYDKPAYIEKKERFLEELGEALTKAGLTPDVIAVEDFYVDTNLDERKYLDHLTSKGSSADMIKTHAIIKNKFVKHLQLDSNTQILNYQSFYDETFGRDLDLLPLPHGVMLNACVYSQKAEYVAAQNKIVYTIPRSHFASQLEEIHFDYCGERRGMPRPSGEKTDRNSIYSKDFTVVLASSGLVRPVGLPSTTIYAADVSDQATYGATRLMISAVNQSWQSSSTASTLSDDPRQVLADRCRDLSITVGDADYNFTCFRTALRKYTATLKSHVRFSEPYSVAAAEEESAAYRDLLDISNAELERGLIKEYFIQLAKKLERDPTLHWEQRAAILGAAINFIPNTSRGEALARTLFGRKLTELKEDPLLIADRPSGLRQVPRQAWMMVHRHQHRFDDEKPDVDVPRPSGPRGSEGPS